MCGARVCVCWFSHFKERCTNEGVQWLNITILLFRYIIFFSVQLSCSLPAPTCNPTDCAAKNKKYECLKKTTTKYVCKYWFIQSCSINYYHNMLFINYKAQRYFISNICIPFKQSSYIMSRLSLSVLLT